MVSSSSCIALFVVLLCVVPALSMINFNTTFNDECAYPLRCSFFNASIWEGGVVPSANDDVNITGIYSEVDAVLFIYFDASSNATSLKSLYVESALLLVDTNTSVTINGSANFNTNASLYVFPNTTLIIGGAFNLASTGRVVANDTITARNATLLGAVYLFAPLQVVDVALGSVNPTLNGFVGTNSITILSNISLDLPAFQVNNVIVGNSAVNFAGAAIINNQLQIAETAVVIAYGITVIGGVSASAPLTGNGSISFQDTASITSASGSAAFTGSVFVGDVIVTLNNVTLNNLITKDGSVVYANGASLAGNTTLFGNLVAYGGVLKISAITLLGNLTVANASLIVSDFIIYTNDYSLWIENTQFSLGGFVSGDLSIHTGSSLTATSVNSAIFGNLWLHGDLSIAAKNKLNVFGNVTFHSNSTFSASVGDNKDADTLLIVHDGFLIVDGKLSYSVDKKPILKSTTYFVAQVFNGTLNGTFNTENAVALSGSKITRELPIQYASSQITLNYKWGIADTQWWLWVILGVGIALLLGIVIGVIVKCKSRRANYQPVR